jgi:hypothetical protein
MLLLGHLILLHLPFREGVPPLPSTTTYCPSSVGASKNKQKFIYFTWVARVLVLFPVVISALSWFVPHSFFASFLSPPLLFCLTDSMAIAKTPKPKKSLPYAFSRQ